MKLFNLKVAVATAETNLIEYGTTVHPLMWQGMDVSKKPEARMHEILNFSFECPVTEYYSSGLDQLKEDVKPNLPWADLHFEQERVGGQPLNPGETWKIWPWSNSADKHRTQGEQFNHTYAERFWPRHAGYTEGGRFLPTFNPEIFERHGIRYRYADLEDVIRVLETDPQTRQAYIPIWFPEDGSHMDRKPCTLGYHVILRHGQFHMVYYIRSCDITRHFRDDIYLAVRLQFWLLDRLKAGNCDIWKGVLPGTFTMHITSLHAFVNDFHALKKARGRT